MEAHVLKKWSHTVHGIFVRQYIFKALWTLRDQRLSTCDLILCSIKTFGLNYKWEKRFRVSYYSIFYLKHICFFLWKGLKRIILKTLVGRYISEILYTYSIQFLTTCSLVASRKILLLNSITSVKLFPVLFPSFISLERGGFISCGSKWRLRF